MKKMKVFLVTILALIFALSGVVLLTACGDDDNPPSEDGGGETPNLNSPTADDWFVAGLGESFGAEVQGTLAQNYKVDDEILLKWTGSNEASLTNTVAWLQQHGYTDFSGEGSVVETLANGMKTYVAEAVNSEGKTMVAEVTYFTQDVEIMGESFKAGELYFSLIEAESPSLPGGTSPGFGGDNGDGGKENPTNPEPVVWPSARILAYFGVEIPTYTDNVTYYNYTETAYGAQKVIVINAFTENANAETSYVNALTLNGYALDGNGEYAKTLPNGSIAVSTYFGLAMNPTNYATGNALSITATFSKNAGDVATWAELNLGVFSNIGIPAYVGATSFDIKDLAVETREQQTASLQQAISILEAYASFLDEEDRQELARLKAQLPLVAQIEAYAITVYGSSEQSFYDYDDALYSAFNYSYSMDDANFRYEYDISGTNVAGQYVITLTRTPLGLCD